MASHVGRPQRTKGKGKKAQGEKKGGGRHRTIHVRLLTEPGRMWSRFVTLNRKGESRQEREGGRGFEREKGGGGEGKRGESDRPILP